MEIKPFVEIYRLLTSYSEIPDKAGFSGLFPVVAAHDFMLLQQKSCVEKYASRWLEARGEVRQAWFSVNVSFSHLH